MKQLKKNRNTVIWHFQFYDVMKQPTNVGLLNDAGT